jgi:hypothetical protein
MQPLERTAEPVCQFICRCVFRNQDCIDFNIQSCLLKTDRKRHTNSIHMDPDVPTRYAGLEIVMCPVISPVSIAEFSSSAALNLSRCLGQSIVTRHIIKENRMSRAKSYLNGFPGMNEIHRCNFFMRAAWCEQFTMAMNDPEVRPPLAHPALLRFEKFKFLDNLCYRIRGVHIAPPISRFQCGATADISRTTRI